MGEPEVNWPDPECPVSHSRGPFVYQLHTARCCALRRAEILCEPFPEDEPTDPDILKRARTAGAI